MRLKLLNGWMGVFLGLVGSAGMAAGQSQPVDPLPSWNDGASKQAIVGFVSRVTAPGSSDYVPPAARIATFDNDGCLWAEQPIYFQIFFAFDRVKQQAPQHPEWETTEPFKSVLAGDYHRVLEGGMENVGKVIAASHTDLTAEDFAKEVRDWLATAKHPKTNRRFTAMVYSPMLELLEYLRDHDFKTFIVSGGGIDFLRVFAEEIYGIPPEQVVGSSLSATFELRDGVPLIVKRAEGLFVDDKAGKPIGIYQHIGRRPIFAAGNSDGDLQMLQYTTIPRDNSDTAPRFGMIVHHTDAKREWAYDRNSHVGKLDKALDDAGTHRWLIVDMKNDWKRIFAFEE